MPCWRGLVTVHMPRWMQTSTTRWLRGCVSSFNNRILCYIITQEFIIVTLKVSERIRMNRPDLVVVHVQSRQFRHAVEHPRAEVTDVVVVQDQLVQVVQT